MSVFTNFSCHSFSATFVLSLGLFFSPLLAIAQIAPGSPENVESQIIGSTVNLSWNAPNEFNDGVYRIYRSSQDFTGTESASFIAEVSNSNLSFTDTALPGDADSIFYALTAVSFDSVSTAYESVLSQRTSVETFRITSIEVNNGIGARSDFINENTIVVLNYNQPIDFAVDFSNLISIDAELSGNLSFQVIDFAANNGRVEILLSGVGNLQSGEQVYLIIDNTVSTQTGQVSTFRYGFDLVSPTSAGTGLLREPAFRVDIGEAVQDVVTFVPQRGQQSQILATRKNTTGILRFQSGSTTPIEEISTGLPILKMQSGFYTAENRQRPGILALDNSGSFTLYENIGNGNIDIQTTFNPQRSLTSFDAVDLNRDRLSDILAVSDDRNTIYLFFQNDATEFILQDSIGTSNAVSIVRTGDVNRDGYTDFVVLLDSGELQLYSNTGSNRFTITTIASAGEHDFNDVRLVDINGNGYREIIALTSTGYFTYDPSSNASVNTNTGGSAYTRFELVDLNANGLPDLLMATDEMVEVYLQSAINGSFSLERSYNLPTTLSGMFAAEYSQEGASDLLVIPSDSSSFFYYTSRLSEPEVRVLTEFIDFGEHDLTFEITRNAIIENYSGSIPLQVTGSSMSDGTYFTTTLAPITLQVDQQLMIAVQFKPNSNIVYRDTLLIQTDDPIRPEIRIPLQGEGIRVLNQQITDVFTMERDAGPYYLLADFNPLVTSTGTMRIERGTVILLDEGKKLIIDGNIEFFGSTNVSERVRFTGITDTTAHNGVLLRGVGRNHILSGFSIEKASDVSLEISQSAHTQLKNFIIDGAAEGIKFASGTPSALLLEDGLLRNHSSNAVSIVADTLEIRNSKIETSLNGIYTTRLNVLKLDGSELTGTGLSAGGSAILGQRSSAGLNPQEADFALSLIDSEISNFDYGIYEQSETNRSGSILINGNTLLRDIHTSALQTTGNQNWNIRVQNARIFDSNNGLSLEHTGEGTVSILSNTLSRFTGVAINFGITTSDPNNPFEVDFNLIEDADIAIRSFNEMLSTNNTIRNNRVAYTLGQVATISKNNFAGNTTNIEVLLEDPNSTIAAAGNFWGTDDINAIRATIIDNNTNPSLAIVEITDIGSEEVILASVPSYNAVGLPGGYADLSWQTLPRATAYQLFVSEGDTSVVIDTLTHLYARLSPISTSIRLNDSAFPNLPDGFYQVGIRGIIESGGEVALAGPIEVRNVEIDRVAPNIEQVNAFTSSRVLTVQFSEVIDTTDIGNLSRWQHSKGINILEVLDNTVNDGVLFVGTGTADIFTYINSGEGRFLFNSNRYHSLSDRFANSLETDLHPAFADLTGNGLTDMLIGTSEGLYFYRNVGDSDEFPVWEEDSESPIIAEIRAFIATNNLKFISPAFGDIKRNGLVDLALGNNSSTVYLFENTGLNSTSQLFSAEAPFSVTTPAISRGIPVLADGNGNGFLDIYIGGDNGNLYYRVSRGQASPTLENAFVLTSANIFGVGVVQQIAPSLFDITGNGFKELLLGRIDGSIDVFASNTTTGIGTNFPNALGSLQASNNTTNFSNINVGSLARPVFAPVERIGVLEEERRKRLKLYTSQVYELSNYDISITDLKDNVGNLTTLSNSTFIATETGFEFPVLTTKLITNQTTDINLSGEIQIAYNFSLSSASNVQIVPQYSLNKGVNWTNLTTADTYPVYAGPLAEASSDTLTWLSNSDIINTTQDDVQIRLIARITDGGNSIDIVGNPVIRELRVDNFHGHRVAALQLLTVEPLSADTLSFSFQLEDITEDILNLEVYYRVGVEGEQLSIPTVQTFANLDSDNYSGEIDVLTLPTLQGISDAVTFIFTPFDAHKPGISDSVTVQLNFNEPPVIAISTLLDTLSGTALVLYEITDVENDAVTLTVEFSTDNEVWQNATILRDSLVFAQEQYVDTLRWDTVADLPGYTGSAWLRVKPFDTNFGNTESLRFMLLNNQAPIVTIGTDALSGFELESGAFAGAVAIAYQVFDTENDTVQLAFEYQLPEDSEWSVATVQGLNTLLGTSTSVLRSITWLSATDLPEQDGVVYFRITPADSFNSGVADTISINLSNILVPTISLVAEVSNDNRLVFADSIAFRYGLENKSGQIITLRGEYSIDNGNTWNEFAGSNQFPSILSDTIITSSQLIWNNETLFSGLQENIEVRIIGNAGPLTFQSNLLDSLTVDNRSEFFVANLNRVNSDTVVRDSIIALSYSLNNTDNSPLSVRGFYRITGSEEVRMVGSIENQKDILPDDFIERSFNFEALPELKSVRDTLEIWLDVTNENALKFNRSASLFIQVDYNSLPEVTILNELPIVVRDTVQIQYAITDPDENDIRLELSYSADGLIYQPATIVSDTTVYIVGAKDYTGTLLWNSYADLPGIIDEGYSLRLTPFDPDKGSEEIIQIQVQNNLQPVVRILSDSIRSDSRVDDAFSSDVIIPFFVNDREKDSVSVTYSWRSNNDTALWEPATVTGPLSIPAADSSLVDVIWDTRVDIGAFKGVYWLQISASDTINPAVSDSILISIDNATSLTISLNVPGLSAEEGARNVLAGDIPLMVTVTNPSPIELTYFAEFSLDRGQNWTTSTRITGARPVMAGSSAVTDTLFWNTIGKFDTRQDSLLLRMRIDSETIKDTSNVSPYFAIDNTSDFNVTMLELDSPKEVFSDSLIRFRYSLADPKEGQLQIRGYWSVGTSTMEKEAVLIGNTQNITSESYANNSIDFRAIPDLRSVKDSVYFTLAVSNENGLIFNRSETVAFFVNYNTPPIIEYLASSDTLLVRGTTAIPYRVTDSDANAVSILLEYQLGEEWFEATVVPGTNITPADTTIFEGELLWASFDDFRGLLDPLISIRLTPIDADTGASVTGLVLTDNNSPPQIRLLSDQVSGIEVAPSILSGNISIPFFVSDVDKDSVRVVFSFRASESEDWLPATLSSDIEPIVALDSTIIYSALWSSYDDVDSLAGDYWVRAVVVDKFSAEAQDSLKLSVDNTSELELISFNAQSLAGGVLELEWAASQPPLRYELFLLSHQDSVRSIDTPTLTVPGTDTLLTISDFEEGAYDLILRARYSALIVSDTLSQFVVVDRSVPEISNAYVSDIHRMITLNFSEPVDTSGLRDLSRYNLESGNTLLRVFKAEAPTKSLMLGQMGVFALRHYFIDGDGTVIFNSSSYSRFATAINIKPTFGDLTGNGVYDAVVGLNGDVRVYINNGTNDYPIWVENTVIRSQIRNLLPSSFTAVSPQLYPASSESSLHDLYITYQGSSLIRLRNTGSVEESLFSEALTIQPAVVYSSPFLTAEDLNDNGVMDLLIGDQDGTIRMYRNTSTYESPVFTSTSVIANLGAEQFAAPAFLDINGDGLSEMLVGNASGNIKIFSRTIETPYDFTNSNEILQFVSGSFKSNLILSSAIRPVIAPVEFAGISKDLQKQQIRLFSSSFYSTTTTYKVSVSNLADTLGNLNNRAQALFSATRPGVERPELTISRPQVPVGTILNGDLPIIYQIKKSPTQTVNLAGEYSLDGGLNWLQASLTGQLSGVSSNSDTLFWNSRNNFNTFENNVRFRVIGTSSTGPFQSNPIQNIRLDNRNGFQITNFELADIDSLKFDEIITFNYSLTDSDTSRLGIKGFYKVGLIDEFKPMTLIGDTVGIGPNNYANRSVQVDVLPLLTSVLDNVTFKLQVTNENALFYNEGPEITLFADYNTLPEVAIVADEDTLVIRDRTTISFRITDPDNDQVQMTVEYSNDSATWIPATLLGSDNIIEVNPLNYDSTFVWDSYQDLPAVNDELFFLRVQVSDERLGNAAVVPVKVFNNIPPSVTIVSDSISADILVNGFMTKNISIPVVVTDRELDSVTLVYSYRQLDSLKWETASVQGFDNILGANSIRIEPVWDSSADIDGKFGKFWFRVQPSDSLNIGVADSTLLTIDNFGIPKIIELGTYMAIVDTTVGGVIPIPFLIADPLESTFSVRLDYRDTNVQSSEWKAATIFNERQYNRQVERDSVLWNSAADFPGQNIAGIAFRLTPIRAEYNGIGFENVILFLKNNLTPTVSFKPFIGQFSGEVPISFLVNDVEKDSVSLQFTYSVDGGASWQQPTLVQTLANKLDSTSYADTLTVIWRSDIDLPDTRNEVQFRIVASDSFQGEPSVANFLLNNQVGPQIVSYTPFGDDLGVSYTTILLDFNRVMNTTISNGAVTICNNLGACYDYQGIWSQGNQRLEIPLHVDTDNFITVRVSGDFEVGLRDALGQVLDGNKDGLSGGDFQFAFNTTIPGDFNGDATVDILDLNDFSAAWRSRAGESSYQPLFDLHPFVGQLPQILATPNGVIDLDDLIVFARMWQESRGRETIDWLAHTGQVEATTIASSVLNETQHELGESTRNTSDLVDLELNSVDNLSNSDNASPLSTNEVWFDFVGISQAQVSSITELNYLQSPNLDELGASLASLTKYGQKSALDVHPVQLLTQKTGVQYEDAKLASDTEQIVTYHLTVNSSDSLSAYELFLRYDDEVLQLSNVEPHRAFDAIGGNTFTLTHVDSAGAFLIVNAANFGESGVLAPGDTLATMQFNVLENRKTQMDVGYYLLTRDADRYHRAMYGVEVSTISEIPQTFELLQNFPNPFNSSTNIRYHLPKDATVNVTIYDVTGRRVTALLDTRQSAGYYSLRYDARFLASGVYFYVINVRADDGTRFRDSRKMMMLK